MSTAETIVRRCPECGDTVEVQPATGRWAALVNQVEVLCDPCGNKIEEAEEADRTADHWARRRTALERRSAIPAALQGIEFGTLDQAGNEPVFASAARWATGDMHGLVLHGPVGAGKTTIAASAAWQRLDLGRLRWVSVPALVARSFGDGQAREQAAAELTGTEALVLDDIDKVKPGEWVASQLFTAIDGRIAAGAALLVTSNLRVSDLAASLPDRFGDAIASRLAGHCEIHPVTGHDRRLA